MCHEPSLSCVQDKSYQLLQLAERLAVVFVNGLAGIQHLGLWGLPTPCPQAGAVVSHRSPPWLLWDALRDAGLCLKPAWLSSVCQLPGLWESGIIRGETPLAPSLTSTCRSKAMRWLWQAAVMPIHGKTSSRGFELQNCRSFCSQFSTLELILHFPSSSNQTCRCQMSREVLALLGMPHEVCALL